jgi:hypothetical protein
MDGTHRRESQIVPVRNRLLKPPTIFYFTKHNHYLTANKGIRRPLPDYENDNFIIGKDNRMVLLCNELRICNPEDMEAFRLPCPTGQFC